jgi:hypothetical protein
MRRKLLLPFSLSQLPQRLVQSPTKTVEQRCDWYKPPEFNGAAEGFSALSAPENGLLRGSNEFSIALLTNKSCGTKVVKGRKRTRENSKGKLCAKKHPLTLSLTPK